MVNIHKATCQFGNEKKTEKGSGEQRFQRQIRIGYI